MRLAVLILLLFVALDPVHAHAQEGSSSTELLEQAETAFEAGTELLETDPEAGRARLDESVAVYRRLIEAGHDNAAIHRNIGNAFMRRGDVGRAIASFRRAEAIDPEDPRVRDSLTAARAMVRTEVSVGTRERVGDAVLFWRGLVSRDVLLGVGLVAWALTWIGCSLRVMTRRGGVAAAVSAVLCLITLGSLALERTLAEVNRHAVIVADGVEAFRGPSESVYEPAFEEPIRAGVEATIVEERDGWARLRLRSGSEAWLPVSAIEEI